MYQRIVKLPEPSSYHLTRGNAIHKVAEEYLLGQFEDVPIVLSKFATEFKNLRSKGAIPEQALVLKNDWSLLGGEEVWTDPQAWLRLKIDAKLDNYLVDFKTGKQYEEHKEQGKLYATVEMAITGVEEVDVEFWYLDSGAVSDPLTFYRKNMQQYIDEYNSAVFTMHNDTTFEPKVNQWCKYCYVKHLCTAYK
jgi:hypothetical protein